MNLLHYQVQTDLPAALAELTKSSKKLQYAMTHLDAIKAAVPNAVVFQIVMYGQQAMEVALGLSTKSGTRGRATTIYISKEWHRREITLVRLKIEIDTNATVYDTDIIARLEALGLADIRANVGRLHGGSSSEVILDLEPRLQAPPFPWGTW